MERITIDPERVSTEVVGNELHILIDGKAVPGKFEHETATWLIKLADAEAAGIAVTARQK